MDGTGYDWSVRQKNSLTVIGTAGQGKAVCEGYAALFYYLCRLNGIACNTVMGSKMVRNEITGELQKDMHAWNFVYLDDGSWTIPNRIRYCLRRTTALPLPARICPILTDRAIWC